ncbi:hypothetical protein [Methanobrevibacter sp. DSM 116169]|uniref:hypothetical protein n=1 Tax=Methanobrevibacter sp. DSM 116169 TaxID=3242727 RepID=UPI0038FC77F7
MVEKGIGYDKTVEYFLTSIQYIGNHLKYLSKKYGLGNVSFEKNIMKIFVNSFSLLRFLKIFLLMK